MEAGTALELWNDELEDRLYLSDSDVDSQLEGEPMTPEPRSCIFGPLGILPEGLVTLPLKLFDQLDSPTYEELFEQNWQLFEESDQQLESSCEQNNVPEDLDLVDSPQVICSVLPEPTCLTELIQAMVMYPPSVKKKVPRKRKRKRLTRQKKSRPPRAVVAMVSDDENDDEPKQPAAPSSSVRRKAEMENKREDLPSAITASSQALPAPLNAALDVVPSFAEHLEYCATDWDYPRALFSIGGYEPDPAYQELISPQSEETLARPASATQPLVPIALDQNSTIVLGAINDFSRKKRSASCNLSADLERVHAPRISPSRNVELENVEPITRPAPRRNKRRRLVR